MKSPQNAIEQAINKPKQLRTRETECHFVISNECFEVWLLEHFENLKGRSVQRSDLSTRLYNRGAITGQKGKNLVTDFPINHWKKAASQVDVLALDEVGTPSATAVARIVPELVALCAQIGAVQR